MSTVVARMQMPLGQDMRSDVTIPAAGGKRLLVKVLE